MRAAARRAGLMWLSGLVPFFFLSYTFANSYAEERLALPTLAFAWESQIPFQAWTILPYWGLNLLYVVSFFVWDKARSVHRHGARLLLVQVIAVACFLAYPMQSAFVRPDYQGNFGPLFAYLYAFDRPFNQLPSLHVAVALVVWAALATSLQGKVARLVLAAAMLMIIFSTLTTYQHHVLDLLGGAALGALSLWMFDDRRARSVSAAVPSAVSAHMAWRYLLGALAVAGLLHALVLHFGLGLAVAYWLALALFCTALCYFWRGAAGFQKQANGRFSPSALMLLGPVLWVTHLNRRYFARYVPLTNEVQPGLWIGRLPLNAAEYRALADMVMVDLTAEFAVDSSRFAQYYSLPMLDLVQPSREQLKQARDCISALHSLGHRNIVVACGLGRGRSACVLFDYLRSQGMSSVHALELLRRARPQMLLSDEQVKLLEQGGVPASRRAPALLAGMMRVVSGVRRYGLEHLALGSSACVYYANHSSHADTAILWAALPERLRAQTRPVAAQDYWGATSWRRFISARVFRALLLDRHDARWGNPPIARMQAAIENGQSLILFPEGTRQADSAPLAPFKPGLYLLARAMPDLQLIPVWLQGVQHILPKGTYLPVPFECSARFGPAIQWQQGESCEIFLARAKNSLEQQKTPG